MRTETIISAIETMDVAGRGLIMGNLSISEQVLIGGDCQRLAHMLRIQLAKDCPAVKVEEPA